MNQNLHTPVTTHLHHDLHPRAHTHTHDTNYCTPPHTPHTGHAAVRANAFYFLLAGLQLVDQLPALPKSQLEITQVALRSLFALLHGAEQGFERVTFRSEGLLVVLEAACRKECR